MSKFGCTFRTYEVFKLKVADVGSKCPIFGQKTSDEYIDVGDKAM